MSRRSSLQSTRHRTRKRTKVRSTYKTGECLQFSVCLQALSCFFCVPEKRPRCGVRVSLDGVAARGLVNGAHRIQVIAWQSVVLTGLRCGDPAYRCLSGILAWRRGLLSALWHWDSSHKYFRGIPVWRRGASDLPFGTGTLNRTTSEMALRGEGTFSRIRIIKDYRTYFFNSNSGNLERKAICR